MQNKKTIPQWVIIEFTTLRKDEFTREIIEKEVRQYIEGEFGGEDEMNEYENDLNARSMKPKNFAIEGHEDITVGDVLNTYTELNNVLVEVRETLNSKGIEAADLSDMSGTELSEKISSSNLSEVERLLNKLPTEIRRSYATGLRSGIGGTGNEPSIGGAGDVLAILYNDGIICDSSA